MNKREDQNDIMIDIDGENDIAGGNNNMSNNNFQNMNMHMNNYPNNNYSSQMSPMSYNNNYVMNNNYNILRNNLTPNMNQQNLFDNNLYESGGESDGRNVSKYFSNNFSYDQKKSESKRKDSRVSFSKKVRD